MNISVFGLGYTGCISLGCLSQSGFHVMGVDVNPVKVELIGSGKPTILEEKIPAIIDTQFKAGRISATTDPGEAVKHSELSMICVGTPPLENGHPNLEHVRTVARQIAAELKLKKKTGFHTIVIRSTVPPGTNSEVTGIIAGVSGKRAGEDFAVVSNPEFLREGSAVEDYYHPPAILIGTEHSRAVAVMKELYRDIPVPVTEVDVKAAEFIKYVNNAFHALKVGFANEVGNICKKWGIDSHRVMDIFAMDRVLNISPAYLKPGFAYGGACLPKDLQALAAAGNDFGLDTPIINAIGRSNNGHKKVILDLIMGKGKKAVGILGLSFKRGTDDLRNSPAVEMAEELLGKGFEVFIYDKHVAVSKLMGANKAYIGTHLPHLSEIVFDDLEYVVSRSELLVITHNSEEYQGLAHRYPGKMIIDLVRIGDRQSSGDYEGICW
ncbi:MAG: UDP-glucose/GDP-mannose dehydrogenase family protein [bacterium]|nr:UDP-glucose/GDP-mannose dehydrogenase family protein [bacterium]